MESHGQVECGAAMAQVREIGESVLSEIRRTSGMAGTLIGSTKTAVTLRVPAIANFSQACRDIERRWGCTVDITLTPMGLDLTMRWDRGPNAKTTPTPSPTATNAEVASESTPDSSFYADEDASDAIAALSQLRQARLSTDSGVSLQSTSSVVPLSRKSLRDDKSSDYGSDASSAKRRRSMDYGPPPPVFHGFDPTRQTQSQAYAFYGSHPYMTAAVPQSYGQQMMMATGMPPASAASSTHSTWQRHDSTDSVSIVCIHKQYIFRTTAKAQHHVDLEARRQAGCRRGRTRGKELETYCGCSRW